MSLERNETKSLCRNKDPPKLLYHGTSKKYFLKIIESGAYRGESYLTDHLITALSHAVKRAKYLKDSPLLLIVDTEKLKEGVKKKRNLIPSCYVTSNINIGSFLIEDAIFLDKDGRIADRTYHGLVDLIEEWKNKFFLVADEEKVRRMMQRQIEYMKNHNSYFK